MWAGLCSAGFVDRGSSFGIFNKDLNMEFASWPGLKAPVKQRVLFFFFFFT